MIKITDYKIPLIEPKYFLTTVAGNVDNPNLTDADFRALLRDTLPIVNWPDREEYTEKFNNHPVKGRVI